MLRTITYSVLTLSLLLTPWANTYAEEEATTAAATDKKEGEHPLDPEIRDAKKRLAALEERVQDYSCRFIKQERVGGELRDHEIIDMKVRHEPFSVFMDFLKPDDVAGQQVAYVEGENDGKLIAKPVGLAGVLGPVSLKPDGPLAMNGQRYPITHVGFVNLTKELIMVAEMDRQYGECQVKHYKGAKLGDRVCTVTEVIHPVRRKNFRFHKVHIFVDDELDLPVRFASWTWPEEEGGKPVLQEEYIYSNIKLNPGFTDDDFKIE